jgi:hypothetical protein
MSLVKVSAVLLAVLAATPAWAHVVATDGPIGVTMHIDPDDQPATGTPARFYLWFKDTTGRLKPQDCRGTFSVSDANDFVIATQPLFARAGSGMTDVHDVAFDKPGVYTVRINGSPVGATTFRPFLITFQVRVAGGASQGFPVWTFYLVGGLLAAGLLWWGLRPAKPR